KPHTQTHHSPLLPFPHQLKPKNLYICFDITSYLQAEKPINLKNMYKVVFNSSDLSDYFHNEKLLFSVKRKRLLLGIRSINNVFENNELIFSFCTSEFTFLYWKIRILDQNLEKEIKIEKVNKSYVMIVDGKEISMKLTNNP